ncbi:MAG: hypothetical protein ACT4PO_09870 [Actinomycetota bacterium]
MTGEPPVSVRAHFERFPATVKGAFVVRGVDTDPHQVVFHEGRVLQVGSRGGRRLAMASATLDIPPRRDVFIPFELSVSDLEPGWYGLECDLDVDGVAGTFPAGRRFAVAWPRATVRRGSIRVDREVRLGDRGIVRVEQVDCGGDSIKIHLVATPPEPVTVRLAADGLRLEVLEIELDRDGGRAKVTAYPLLRSHGTLRIELAPGRGRARDAEGALDVTLP